jgi:anti-anti-sigma factor
LLKRRDLHYVTVLIVGSLIIFLAVDQTDLLSYLWTAKPTLGEAVSFGALVLVVNSVILNTFIGRQRALLHQNIALTSELQERNTAIQEANEAYREENETRLKAEEERARLQEEIIEVQRATLRELSTPIIPVMARVVVMPLVGAIDTNRAKDIMRALLTGIDQHKAYVVIIDLTGVKVIDSGVAGYLHNTVKAAQFKGTSVILSGISDAVAEAIVDLNIDWRKLKTLRDLQTSLEAAMQMTGTSLNA